MWLAKYWLKQPNSSSLTRWFLRNNDPLTAKTAESVDFPKPSQISNNEIWPAGCNIVAFGSEADVCYAPLVPRLCLGTHCTLGSAIATFRSTRNVCNAAFKWIHSRSYQTSGCRTVRPLNSGEPSYDGGNVAFGSAKVPLGLRPKP